MFGRYELHDLLGRGGMGEVYRALDTVRDRTVALKLLPRHLATDENFKTRFRRESRLAAKLNDPHIIPIHDFGEIEGQLFIDMRLVEGRDLGSVLSERGPLPIATAVKVMSQVASALDAAHQSGLVHRDVKPSNVLLAGWVEAEDVDPFAYLVDFGIARAANQEGTALTATSGTVGTVAYMSPERIGGSPGDRRTDIYALGCVLFETLTGHKPFDGEMFAIMYAHMNTPPPRVTAYVRNAPPALDAVVAKAMAKDPDQRYATAGEFGLATRQALRAAPVQGPPQGPPRQGPPPQGPPRQGPPSQGVPPQGPPRQGPPSQGSLPQGPPLATPTRAGSGPTPAYYTPPPQHQTPVPAGPSRSAAPPTQQPPSGPQHFPTVQAPRPAGAPPPGPVRPTSPSQPVRRPPADWKPPPPSTPHPSGPIPQPLLPTPPERRGSKRVLIGAGAIAVIAAVVLTLVFTLGGGGSPSSNNSSNHSSSNSGGPVTSYRTGSAATPAISWDHFGSYSPLVGTQDGASSGAFKQGTCHLLGHKASVDPDGLVDQVECTYSGSPVQTAVARFASNDKVTAFLRSKSDMSSYRISPIKMGERIVGLLYVSPVTAADIDVLTYFCGLPNYLVQFFSSDTSSITRDDVRSQYWSAAPLLDVTPQPCNSDFSGPVTGSAPAAASAKQSVATVDESMLKAFVRRQNADWNVTLVHVPVGAELAVVGQKRYVAFWTWNKTNNELVVDGSSRYPYDPKTLGPPQATGRGALLTGMSHATFIVTGTFSTDGSGNAVAYTTLDGKTWGAIKAQPDGNLMPTAGYVGIKGIGLSEDFGFENGMLVTSDCRKSGSTLDCSNPIVKYWKWDATKSEFVRDH